MRTLSLFDNVLTNWDRAFFDGDYSYWRRKGEGVRGEELEDSFEYHIPLAGFKKEDIKATISDGLMYVLAKKKNEGTYSYSFQIPEGGDTSKISAKHENGLLTVTVGKADAVKPVSIEID